MPFPAGRLPRSRTLFMGKTVKQQSNPSVCHVGFLLHCYSRWLSGKYPRTKAALGWLSSSFRKLKYHRNFKGGQRVKKVQKLGKIRDFYIQPGTCPQQFLSRALNRHSLFLPTESHKKSKNSLEEFCKIRSGVHLVQNIMSSSSQPDALGKSRSREQFFHCLSPILNTRVHRVFCDSQLLIDRELDSPLFRPLSPFKNTA